MSTAFVLGNGLSRQGLPLQQLKQHGKIYGCNALYRDFVPDVLVATDQPIAEAIQESGYTEHNKFYTRRPNPKYNAMTVPKSYFGYSSGPIATALAALDQHQQIYLIGFDLGPTLNKKFNNLYARTEFYKTPDSSPTYTGNWIKQIKQICKDFPETKFTRVCGPTTAQIQDLQAISNLEHLPMDLFQTHINNLGDS